MSFPKFDIMGAIKCFSMSCHHGSSYFIYFNRDGNIASDQSRRIYPQRATKRKACVIGTHQWVAAGIVAWTGL